MVVKIDLADLFHNPTSLEIIYIIMWLIFSTSQKFEYSASPVTPL